MTTGFCAIDDLQNLLQLTIPAEKVGSADAAILAATEAIRNYTNQKISLVTDETIILDGNGRIRIFLPELPVVNVTSVTLDGVLLVNGTDYKLGSHGIIYRLGGNKWTDGIQNIEIIYSHGFATIPDDIKTVCVRAAARAYQAGLKAEEMNGISIASYGLGDYSVTYGQDQVAEGVSSVRPLLLSEKDLLNRYRLVIQ